MSVQWFPGHMARAKRELTVYAAKAQVFFHVLDARAPQSTFYPALFRKRKPILVFAKLDLADSAITQKWKQGFRAQGYSVVSSAELKRGNFLEQFGFSAKALVVGLPNVGKSTLINKLVGKKKAKTGAIPGITRGPQWVKLSEKLYLLDTPGIFYPNNVDEEKAWRLAAVGVLPARNYEPRVYEIAGSLLRYAQSAYNLFQDAPADFFDFLEGFAEERGFLLKGGKPNLEKAAQHLILDFQQGKWGRITLEVPT